MSHFQRSALYIMNFSQAIFTWDIPMSKLMLTTSKQQTSKTCWNSIDHMDEWEPFHRSSCLTLTMLKPWVRKHLEAHRLCWVMYCTIPGIEDRQFLLVCFSMFSQSGFRHLKSFSTFQNSELEVKICQISIWRTLLTPTPETGENCYYEISGCANF